MSTGFCWSVLAVSLIAIAAMVVGWLLSGRRYSRPATRRLGSLLVNLGMMLVAADALALLTAVIAWTVSGA